jgi:hypothetical protein
VSLLRLRLLKNIVVKYVLNYKWCTPIRRITHNWRTPLRARVRKTAVARLAGFVRFSRTHIPARRKTVGFALLGGQERRQFFTLCDITTLYFRHNSNKGLGQPTYMRKPTYL